MVRSFCQKDHLSERISGCAAQEQPEVSDSRWSLCDDDDVVSNYSSFKIRVEVCLRSPLQGRPTSVTDCNPLSARVHGRRRTRQQTNCSEGDEHPYFPESQRNIC